MRKHLSRTRRARWGIGALTVASLAAAGGVTTSAQQPERTSAPSQETAPTGTMPETQSGPLDERPDFVGVADDSFGASASGTEDPDSKSEDLGTIGSNDAHTPDTPGATGASDAETTVAEPTIPAERVGDSDADLAAAVANGATARVIVMTKTQTGLEAEMSATAVDAQHARIDTALTKLQTSLEGTDSKKVFEFDVVPSAVYEVGEAGMDALLANPNVASIALDGKVEAQLDSSTGVIDSDLLNGAGVLGDGFNGSPVPRYEVAIIDSGVDNGHNAFTGRIVAQACFVDDNSCPNGTNSQIGGNAAEECTHSNDCDHGTHVGGIAAGAVYAGGHEGVAQGAGIVAINVASDNPGGSRWTASFSDIDQALQHVFNLKTSTRPDIAALNMSIGTSSTFADGATCDGVSATTNDLMGQLRAEGVAPVVAAGNSGSNTQMSFPGCASNALAIGATDDGDVPAGFTNSSPGLEWWAPGVSIVAPVPTGDNEGSKDGTSMAAPHVTGAFALLSECTDGNGVAQTLASKIDDLNNSGVNVTRNGVTRRRINLLDAATRNVNNNDFAFPESIAPAGNVDDFDFNVCGDAEAGEPGSGSFAPQNSVWWTWTPSATGMVTISTEDSVSNATTFDTTLSVYTGDSLGSLVLKAQDDDSGTGLRSLVTMPVHAGTTYRIQVDGFGASNGLLNLHVGAVVPVLCQGVAATMLGTPASDTIGGTNGNDVIVTFGGDDTVHGNGGNDRICTDAGEDTVRGGGGNDLVYGGPDPDFIVGNDGDDTLVGNAGGGDNNDVGDTITGSAGEDVIDGWVGNDILQGGPQNDSLSGAAGSDTVDFSGSIFGITANLTTGTSTGLGTDSLSEIENIRGGPGNDTLKGDALANRIDGAAGNDTINGRGGNDNLKGGTGKDTARFDGAPGSVTADLTTGTATGDGTDHLDLIENLSGSSHGDFLTGNVGVNTLSGRSGNDVVRGGGANDRVFGHGGSDTLRGGDNVDTIYGGEGHDDLLGQSGNDKLFGEKGNDAHFGGANQDTCNGGLGADTKNSCEAFSNIP